MTTEPVGSNADFPWDSFSSKAYYAHNYASLRHDDRRIAERIRDHFARADFPDQARGIDVGTGPNLYPALSVLPFVGSILLYEYSAHNIGWLRNQQASGWPVWDDGLKAFWELYQTNPAYASAEGRSLLRDKVEIAQGSVFDLDPATTGQFDSGTMFFVAESLSDEYSEFAKAIERFLGVLRPGAPFAAAFMEMSRGYHVDGIRYPATAIGVDDLSATLGRGATGLEFERIDPGEDALRPGYEGMIVATGFAAPAGS